MAHPLSHLYVHCSLRIIFIYRHLTSLSPLYKNGIYRAIPIFLILDPKHRLLVPLEPFQGDTSEAVLFYVLVFKILCAVGALCMFSYFLLSLGN